MIGLEFFMGVLQNATWDILKALLRIETSIEQAVREIGEKLDEQQYVMARKAARHLVAAYLTDVPSVRTHELWLARQAFAALAALEPEVGEHGNVDSRTLGLLVAGSLGNFYCFWLMKDHQNALFEAYTFTKAYPRVGVQVFPSQLFASDYRSELDQLHRTLDKERQQHADLWVQSVHCVGPKERPVLFNSPELQRREQSVDQVEQRLVRMEKMISSECEARLAELTRALEIPEISFSPRCLAPKSERG